MALQPQAVPLISNGTISNGTSFVLTSTGVFTDTQTVTINGVVFTSVTAIGATPGNFLIGANAAASLANLTALINNPTVTNTTQVALSAANAALIKTTLGITATNTATTMTASSNNRSVLTATETQTNAAITVLFVSNGFGHEAGDTGSIQFVASGITSGNGVFTVEVSNDGVNWTTYNRLTSNATNTNAQNDTRVASLTLSSNTSSVVILPDPFAYYRVNLTPTTDGVYSAVAYVI